MGLRDGPPKAVPSGRAVPAAVGEADDETEETEGFALSSSDRRVVLLVDDEEPMRRLGRRMLERLGYQVLSAVDGAAAVEVFREHEKEIFLVLMDLSMPHLDGIGAMREIHGIQPRTKVILSSGCGSFHMREEIDSKAAGFIRKPYTLEQLRGLLESIIA